MKFALTQTVLLIILSFVCIDCKKNDNSGDKSLYPVLVMKTYTGTGANPVDICFDGNNMWTANSGENSVTKISPDGSMVSYTGTGLNPVGIAFDGTNMWTANSSGTVTKVTPTGTMTTFSLGDASVQNFSIAFDGINMWIGGYLKISKLSPEGIVTNFFPELDSFIDIAYDGTNMWAVSYGLKSILKITPSGLVSTFKGLNGGPNSIAFDGTNMWTCNEGNLSKINPEGIITNFNGKYGMAGYGMIFAGNTIWVAWQNWATKIDSNGNQTLYSNEPILVSRDFISPLGIFSNKGIAYDGKNLWITNTSDNSVTKITI